MHLVKCATANGTITAQLINGIYTIPAEAQTVSIETALLGDANGDGSIKATDLLIMKQIIVKTRIPSELQMLALDIDGNRKIIATDLLRIKQNIVKKMGHF